MIILMGSSLTTASFFVTLTFAIASGQESSSISSGLDVVTVQEFDRLDRDRNSSLDEREFAFTEIAERFFQAGKRTDLQSVYRTIDSDGNKTIELLELVNSRQNRNARLLDRVNGRNFIRSDTDQDGLIAKAEYLEQPNADEAIFRRIDLNGSAKVGPFEWLHGVRQSPINEEFSILFAKLDTDDDGSVSAAEFAKGNLPDFLADAFEGIDLNGNREIGPSEFAKAVSLPPGRLGIPDHLVESFEKIDRNRDQTISFREFSRYSPAARESGRKGRGPGDRKIEHLFEAMDLDKNRSIDLSEYVRMRRGGHPGKGPGPRGKGPGLKGKGLR